MRITKRILAGFALVLLLGPAMLAGQKQKDEKEEIDLLIKSVKFLEEKPLDKKAKDVRSWGLKWIIATDKVSVKICSLVLSGPEKYRYNGELVAQHTIGMAAFKLSNPDKAGDDGVAQLAGIQSALIAYEAIVVQEPKAKLQFMDELLAKRADGSLAKYVAENNCKSKS